MQTLEQVIEKAVKKLLIDHTNAEHPAYIATAVRKAGYVKMCPDCDGLGYDTKYLKREEGR